MFENLIITGFVVAGIVLVVIAVFILQLPVDLSTK